MARRLFAASRAFTEALLGAAILLLPHSGAADLLSSAKLEPRARVLIVQDPGATDSFRPHLEKVRPMVDRAITRLTHKPTVPEAWRSLISTQDVVGIKVFSSPGANSGTRPAVVAAVVEGLLAAGLPPKRIVVWDRQIADLRLAGYSGLAERYNIRLAGSAQAGWDPTASTTPTPPSSATSSGAT